MSHFIGLCFGDNWEDDLEQYYEGLEVEAYIRYTKEEAIEKAKEYHTSNYEYALKQLSSDVITPENLAHYTKVVNDGCSLTDEDAWKQVQDWGYQMQRNVPGRSFIIFSYLKKGIRICTNTPMNYVLLENVILGLSKKCVA